MIVDRKRRFVFIHIPRCAGMSIKRTLQEHCPGAQVVMYTGRHMRADAARQAVGPKVWEDCYRFAVIRNPWDIVASDYRLTLAHVSLLGPEAEEHWERRWYDRVLRVAAYQPNFGRFVEEEYLENLSFVAGGFWRTWCLDRDGSDLGVEPILFDQVLRAWPAVCRRIGLDPVPLRHENGAGEIPAPQWTPLLVDAVGGLCHEDVTRFNFTPPGGWSRWQ